MVKDKSLTKADDHVKGVHTPMNIAGGQGDKKRNGSNAGYHAAHAKKGLAGRTGASQEKGWAVQAHKKVIAESRAMPKPNLTKDEDVEMQGAPANGELVASEEHDCPYCQELQAQDIHDEDCPYCAQMHDPNADGHSDDCPYCAVMNHDAGAEGHPDDCPYCADMGAQDPNADGLDADCPYCARSAMDAGGVVKSVMDSPPSDELLPTSQDSQDYAGQDLPRPSLDKPAAISAQPSGSAAPTDDKTNQNIILEDTQGGPAQQEYQDSFDGSGPASPQQDDDSVDGVIDEIDALGSDEVPLRPHQSQTDDADLAIGTNMENNVSRLIVTPEQSQRSRSWRTTRS